ncbi:hypothetical protein [Priestia megaterium]|uniref:hypothetical protein n=1 Tax=Priestia megaterium TaxID=1404 RepID=UPI00101D4209|nr:hypothetical protein [Priestia megaterium]
MARIINFWSFICALLCVVFFFISIAGFFGISNWTSALRSILTVVISGVLIFVTGFILFTGYLFS